MRNYSAWLLAVTTGFAVSYIPFPWSIPSGLVLGAVSFGVFTLIMGEV